MHRRYFIAAAIVGMCGNAHADFTVITSPVSASHVEPAPHALMPKPTTAAAAPPPEIQGSNFSDREKKHKPKGSKPRRVKATAQGFGIQIPLEFAVRQIVPKTIKVIYGDDANKDALVDWRGGRRWSTVLRNAIHPLGLDVKLRGTSAYLVSSSKSVNSTQ